MAKESEFSADPAPQPVIRLREAELRFGRRVLWRDLDLDIAAGEFVAVLGPNGTGKTSLLKVLLGQNALSAGSARIEGRQVHAGNPAIGYIPQQRGIDPHTPMRGRDLVRMGLDGHRWGMGLLSAGRRKKPMRGIPGRDASVRTRAASAVKLPPSVPAEPTLRV